MNFCPSCGQKAAEAAAFCQACGTDLKMAISGTVDPRARQQSRDRGNRPSRPQETANAAGIAAHRELEQRRMGKRVRWMFVLVAGAIIVLASIFLMDRLPQGFGVIGIAVGFVTAIVGAVVMPSERLNKDEYAALPGAVVDGSHRCIFCGGRGIYRHTPYKSDTTLADCSRCKAELWKE